MYFLSLFEMVEKELQGLDSLLSPDWKISSRLEADAFNSIYAG